MAARGRREAGPCNPAGAQALPLMAYRLREVAAMDRFLVLDSDVTILSRRETAARLREALNGGATIYAMVGGADGAAVTYAVCPPVVEDSLGGDGWDQVGAADLDSLEEDATA